MAKTQLITPSEARSRGLPRYFTGQPCKRGHVSERLTSIRSCIECQRGHVHAFYTLNKPRLMEQARERYLANPERWHAMWRHYYYRRRSERREHDNQRSLKWQREHPESVNAKAARWRKCHRDKCNAKFSRYRAGKLEATPPWVDHAAINAYYEEAMRRTRQTGIAHDVDHIEPLVGKRSCGLHVSWNLQVIPATENRRKGNRRS